MTMEHDTFGNLKDWGPVLEQIEALHTQGELDDQQDGLLRILRYRDNWRLRETVLTCVKDMHHPTPELLEGILGIMMDETLYHDVRILAAEALAALAPRVTDRREPGAVVDVTMALTKMDALLEGPGPPYFLRAIDGVRHALGKSSSFRQHERAQQRKSERTAT